MNIEKVISTFEKIISVCKEDGCNFVDLSFEDAEQILAMLKEQEKPNGKCVNECECWDSAYERGKQDALKEQEAKPVEVCGQGFTIKYGHCPKCGKGMDSEVNPHWCGFCGQAVKWNA